MRASVPKYQQLWDKNPTVWRFLTFDKFADTLSNGLRFARIDTLGDAWESRSNVLFQNEILAAADGEDHAKRLADLIGEQVEGPNKRYYVSCWSMAKQEFEFMWKLHSDSTGVALRSTYQALHAALSQVSDYKNIKLEPMLYDVDDCKEPIEPDWRHKRKAFRPENELRACIDLRSELTELTEPQEVCIEGEPVMAQGFAYRDLEGNQTRCPELVIERHRGLYVRVDFSTLIEKVYLHPDAKPWLLEMVRHACVSAGLPEVPVVFSDIAKPPPNLPR